jgi:hypothetical protein
MLTTTATTSRHPASRRRLLLAVALLALAACGDDLTHEQRLEKVLRRQRSDLVFGIETMVRASLKDPASAKFGRTMFGRNADSVFFCGRINARNGYGGYTGEVGWVFDGGTFLVEPVTKRAEVASYNRIINGCNVHRQETE